MEHKGHVVLYMFKTSQRIIALRSMCVGCIMIAWVNTPPPLLLYAKGGWVYMEDPIGYGST
jgi:hypothetical protein